MVIAAVQSAVQSWSYSVRLGAATNVGKSRDLGKGRVYQGAFWLLAKHKVVGSKPITRSSKIFNNFK